MGHSHTTKVLTFELNNEFNWIASMYGCTDCDEMSKEPFPDDSVLMHDHREYNDDCFGCKAKTLQLAVGDAHSAMPTSGKKWDAENHAFADAVKQGINPDGVFMKDIDAAHKASEILGRAYDAETMLPAHKITKGVAEIYKEIGTQ